MASAARCLGITSREANGSGNLAMDDRVRTAAALCGAAALVVTGFVLTIDAPAETPAMGSGHHHPGAAPVRLDESQAPQAAFYSEMTAVNAHMHEGMQVEPSGDVDRDFMQMMIPHHQGAIDMALVVLKYGRDEKLKRLAQSIIVEQGQEIAYMRSLLAPPSGVAGNIHPASGQ
jgi:hypothetical protein